MRAPNRNRAYLRRLLLCCGVPLLLLLSSCAACRKLSGALERDSVRVEVVEREVVVRDTVLLEIPRLEERQTLRCDTSLLENRYARSEARILPGGDLYHSLSTIPQSLAKPIAVEVKVRDSIVFRDRLLRQVVEMKRELTPWQRFAISGFYFMLLLFVSLLLLWSRG